MISSRSAASWPTPRSSQVRTASLRVASTRLAGLRINGPMRRRTHHHVGPRIATHARVSSTHTRIAHARIARTRHPGIPRRTRLRPRLHAPHREHRQHESSAHLRHLRKREALGTDVDAHGVIGLVSTAKKLFRQRVLRLLENHALERTRPEGGFHTPSR